MPDSLSSLISLFVLKNATGSGRDAFGMYSFSSAIPGYERDVSGPAFFFSQGCGEDQMKSNS